MESRQTVPGVAAAAVRIVPVTVRTRDSESVVITGDFTGWSPKGIPMRRLEAGRYRVNLRLSPGHHEFRLIADGEWADDLDSERRSPNPYGSENSVLEVQ